MWPRSCPGAVLSGLDVDVLSIYGDLDTVLNKATYEKAKSKLPSSFEERILAGGNHAQFGDYGEQPGDSPAALPAEEQRSQTASFISAWLREK